MSDAHPDESFTGDAHGRSVEDAERAYEQARDALKHAGQDVYAALGKAGMTSEVVARAIGVSGGAVRRLNADGDAGWRPCSRAVYEDLDAFALSRLGKSWDLAHLRLDHDRARSVWDSARQARERALAAEASRLGGRVTLGILYVQAQPERRAGLLLRRLGDALARGLVTVDDDRPWDRVLDVGGDGATWLALRVGACGGEAERRWVLAACPLDHGLVADDELREFLGWLLVTLPTFAADVLDRRLALARRLPGTRLARWWRRLSTAGVGLVGVLLLLLALAVLAVLLGAARLPGLRAVGRAGAGLFLPLFGLTFAYTRGQTLMAAHLDRATCQLELLQRHCRRIAIVAHGQGAAVAHALASRDLTERVVRLATMGSSLRRLQLARALSLGAVEPMAGYTGLGYWAAGVMGVMIPGQFFAALAAESLGQGDWGFAMFVVSLAVVTLSAFWGLAAWGRRLLHADFAAARRGLGAVRPSAARGTAPAWVDISTGTDLVADGPHGVPLGEAAVEVTYEATPIADHRSYLKPGTESLDRLLTELAQAEQAPGSLAHAHDAVATAERRHRVRWLVVGRWVAGLSGVATATALVPAATPDLVGIGVSSTGAAGMMALLKGWWLLAWEWGERPGRRARSQQAGRKRQSAYEGFVLHLAMLVLMALAAVVSAQGWWGSLARAGHRFSPPVSEGLSSVAFLVVLAVFFGLVVMLALAKALGMLLSCATRHQQRAADRQDPG